jgi:hypothetical protein
MCLVQTVTLQCNKTDRTDRTEHRTHRTIPHHNTLQSLSLFTLSSCALCFGSWIAHRHDNRSVALTRHGPDQFLCKHPRSGSHAHEHCGFESFHHLSRVVCCVAREGEKGLRDTERERDREKDNTDRVREG